MQFSAAGRALLPVKSIFAKRCGMAFWWPMNALLPAIRSEAGSWIFGWCKEAENYRQPGLWKVIATGHKKPAKPKSMRVLRGCEMV
jgi:hypothetical protein